jgi:hypothetical protein
MRVSSFLVAAFVVAPAAFCTTVSYTGILASPEDSSAAIVVTMAQAGVLSFQTWGFGGGTNAAFAPIPAGGFDPFVGVFSGSGASAVFIDGSSDVLSNYSSFTGCPPAGIVNIDGKVCGDVAGSMSLAAGTYTVLLTDAGYIPNAVFDGTLTLGDGFTDLTDGAFQTCNGNSCVNDTANWALDITTPGNGTATPEPGSLWTSGIALAAWLAASARRRLCAIQQTNSIETYERRVK